MNLPGMTQQQVCIHRQLDYRCSDGRSGLYLYFLFVRYMAGILHGRWDGLWRVGMAPVGQRLCRPRRGLVKLVECPR